jgi:voltage-gated potassium channel
MGILIKLFVLSVIVILIGTFLMYSVEYNKPNSEIKSLEDALWWCVATVTTVGYGDIVPVTGFGRYVAIVYMGFGISMITLFISTITNNFYKKRIENIDTKKDKDELEFFKKAVMTKLLELEKQQNKILDLFDLLHLTKDSDKLKENDNTNS